jgi:YVTN family beta-propeller protein
MMRFALLAVALTACHVTVNDPGTDPPAQQLYFPSGIAVDPDKSFLYISNNNSDLRYGGGTVQVIDLDYFHNEVAKFRAGMPTDGLCQSDPLDPYVAVCGQTNPAEPKPNAQCNPYVVDAVRVGNFAGNMILQKLDDNTRELWVSVRGDPSITRVDIDTSGATPTLQCFAAPPSGRRSCGDNQIAPLGCEPSWLVQNYGCTQNGGASSGNCQMFANANLPTSLPTEPFGMALDQGTLANGDPYQRMLVSHLSGGQVSVIDVHNRANPQLLYISDPFFEADTQMRHGAFALAPQHPGQASSLWYMTSNIEATVSVFRVADVGVVITQPQVAFTLSAWFAAGTDIRAISFARDGNRAFLTENNPPSVVVIDTHPQPGGSSSGGQAALGNPANQVVDIINVCQEPSNMRMRDVTVEGAPGTPSRVGTQLWVVCFLSNQVMVVDPDSREVLSTILVGRGPNDIAFDAHHGYVTNFSESTISVIDLDPGSFTQYRQVAKIGIPAQPPTQ